MTINELYYRQFEVMKLIASKKNKERGVYVKFKLDAISEELRGKGMHEVEVLLAIVEKLINEHNSQINANEERIRKLEYKDYGKPFNSKYFKGIEPAGVLREIKENPDKDIYEIYELFKNRI